MSNFQFLISNEIKISKLVIWALFDICNLDFEI